MEMAQTKLIAISALLLLACSCGPRMEWVKHSVDGSFTGVTAVAGDNVPSALGSVDSVYHAPNGRVFDCGSTPLAARLLLDAQPGMAYLKKVLAYAPEEMKNYRPESPLSNWAVDAMMLGVESKFGRHVDAGILNFGGIRVDMPQGDVLLDDIISMFPFNNHLCYLTLSGSDLRYIYDFMAGRGKPEIVGGARFVIRDGKAEDITINGEPLDDDKLYGVATIDFLLDGGDGLYVARNARELLISDCYLRDWFVPYVRTFGASGDDIKYEKDGRITIE